MLHIWTKRKMCALLSPPPLTPLFASFGHDDSWQAPPIFFINGSYRHQSAGGTQEMSTHINIPADVSHTMHHK